MLTWDHKEKESDVSLSNNFFLVNLQICPEDVILLKEKNVLDGLYYMTVNSAERNAMLQIIVD